MKGQAIIIFFLGLIVLKLYPVLGTAATYFAWIALPLMGIGFIVLGILWAIGKIGNWIDNAPERKNEKKELREISKTLKDIDYIEKRIKKLK